MISYTYQESEPPQPPLDTSNVNPIQYPSTNNFDGITIQKNQNDQNKSPIIETDDIHPDNPSKQMLQICMYLRQTQGSQFQQNLHLLHSIFKRGYSRYFTTSTDLMRKMMNHFTFLSKNLKTLSSDISPNYQFRMLFILSLIAQLLQSNPKLYFPFTRRFLINVFNMDYQLLKNSSKKDQIIAILGTILENISKQGRLLRRYKIIEDVKYTILSNYSLISEIYSLKIFNKAILNLNKHGANFTSQQFHKYQIITKISSFIQKNQIDIFLVQMKMTIICLQSKEIANKIINNPIINNCQK